MNRAEIEVIVRSFLADDQKKQTDGQIARLVSRNVSHEMMRVPVEISARHVHLSEEHALQLFGEPLEMVRELSQPGQYLSRQRVRLIGTKGVLDNVAVLGPSRSRSQVEISMTDARALGVKAPVRQSGDVQGTPGIVLASNSNIVAIEEGVIVAARHIHMTPADAERFHLRDKDLVSVALQGGRPMVLRDVLVRVHHDFCLTLHIDADEANACGCNGTTVATIVSQEEEACCAA